MANEEFEGGADVTADVAFDSNKAILACQGILSSVVAAQEQLREAGEGRFEFRQRQRILAAGLSAENQALRMTLEFPQVGAPAAPTETAAAPALPADVVRREELEALVEHRIELLVDKAAGDARTAIDSELRDALDQKINAQSAALESRLLGIVQENLTDSLRTLEESLEDRIREIAAAAATDAAERERVNKALDEARRAAEKGLKAAGGDELLEQIDDIRDIRMDVGDYMVGDIEEVGGGEEPDEGPAPEIADDEEFEAFEASEELPAVGYGTGESEPIQLADDQIDLGADEEIEGAPDDDEEIEGAPDDDEEIEGAPADDEEIEGAPADDEEIEGAPDDEDEPIAIDEDEPIAIEEDEPIAIDEGEPIAIDEGEPIAIDEGEPIEIAGLEEGEEIEAGEADDELLADDDAASDEPIAIDVGEIETLASEAITPATEGTLAEAESGQVEVIQEDLIELGGNAPPIEVVSEEPIEAAPADDEDELSDEDAAVISGESGGFDDIDVSPSAELDEIDIDVSAESGAGDMPLEFADSETEVGHEPIVVEALEDDEEVEPLAAEDIEAINRYLELASKLRGRKNYSAAAELYNKVLELDMRNFEAHIGLGAVHLQTPDYDAAEQEFQTALAIDTDSPAGYLGMGEVHFLKKDYDQAIAQYSQCLERDDDLAQGYCNRGLSYYYVKNHKKAFLDLQRAYRLDPEIPNIKKYLQMVMKVIKKQEDAK